MSAAQILNADHACGESIDHTFRYDDNGIYVNVVNSGIQAATYRVDALLLD
jgi:ferredoxin